MEQGKQKKTNATRKRELSDRVDAILGVEGFDSLIAAGMEDLSNCDCEACSPTVGSDVVCRTLPTAQGFVSLMATRRMVDRWGLGESG